MLQQVYEIHEDGFVKETYVASVLDGVILDADKVDFIAVDPTQSFHKMKWNGTEWVEGETQGETDARNEMELLASMQPSQQDLADADFEIKIITLLMDLEVI